MTRRPDPVAIRAARAAADARLLSVSHLRELAALAERAEAEPRHRPEVCGAVRAPDRAALRAGWPSPLVQALDTARRCAVCGQAGEAAR